MNRLTAVGVVVGVVVFAALVFAAFAFVDVEAAPSAGTVVEKRFTPAHWEDGYRTVQVPKFECRTVSDYNYSTKRYESKQECGTHMVSEQVYESHHHFVGDRYQLRLRSCKQDGKKQKCREGWRTVSPDEYSGARHGEWFGGDE